MSVATLSTTNLLGGKAKRLKDPPWQRPKDWPDLPTVSVGESKFVALVGVYELDNFVSFFATISGGYTVDWGDGSAPQNFASNATAHHNYSFAAGGLGPLTSEGFKTAIVTVTPTIAGRHWTALDITGTYVGVGALNRYIPAWLDVRMSGPSLNGLTLGVGANFNPNQGTRQFEFIGPNSFLPTQLSGLFRTMTSLENVIFPRSFTATATDLHLLFSGCTSLESVPPMDTSLCTNFADMFGSCASLTSVPDLDTSQGTSFSQMFGGCAMLKTIPPLNTSKATTMATMFASCSSLESIPALDMHLVTAATNMFLGCMCLRSVPPMDTSKVTNFNAMFSGCARLITVPLLSCAGVTVGWVDMFKDCAALQIVPAMDWSGGASGAGATAFTGCASLGKILITGLRFSITIPSRLTAAELNRVYTNLGIASGAQTITVSGNPGIAGDDPTIATAKGWTVTGS